MLGPPLPPADPWGDGVGGTGGAAAWRERERRQRSVRLLMMFLLMLLLMDGEEHQARQRRGDYKLRTAPKPLPEDVFKERQDQDERIHKAMRNHERYKYLVEKNGGTNVDLQVRKWVDQQQELEQDTFDTAKAKVKEDPENEHSVVHFPWNSTGFYRGEWVREGAAPEDEDKDAAEEKETPEAVEEVEKDVEEEKVEEEKFKTLDPVDLETPMAEMLKERDESVGVFLLPRGMKMNMGNVTASLSEMASAKSAAKALESHARRSPQSPFLRVGHQEAVSSVIEKAFFENATSAPRVTLSKPSGRAAFQFYSRAIPAMKEISLVDGLVKLYDSSTVGYSTRRDILLRARGVMIHSIGRLSLVSNADLGRSAFVLLKDKRKNDDDKASSRRRLMVEQVLDSGDFSNENVEMIRDNLLALYPFDTGSKDLDIEKGGWQLTSFDLEDAPFDEGDDARVMRDVLKGLFSYGGRRLDEQLAVENMETVKVEKVELDSEDEIAPEPKDEKPDVETERSLSNPRAEEKQTEKSTPGNDVTPVKNIKKSNVVIPYPFVPDDKEESIRKAKTPLTKKMQPRDQHLEVNAGLCEFEINLDVAEIEWTLGQWRKMMSRLVKETNQLDPSMLKKEADEVDKEDEDSVKTAHTRTKHSRSHPRAPPLRGRIKTPQDQALVMSLIGAIHSPNCDFTASLNATAIRTDWEHTTSKAINYSFYMMLACLVQIVVLLRQLLHTQSQSAATRVSLLSVGWQTVVDALVCLAHIYLSLAMQPLFTAFASVAFFKLLIFCVIEMKYMAIIIQARNTSNGGQNTTELLRRQVAMLHLRFYVALVGSFLAFFYAGSEYRTIYILILYSFWVPQIIQNVITEAKRPLHHYYIYGMSSTRLLAPLYIFAVPNNFLKEVYPDAPTNLFMCELLVLWVGIQTAVLIAQGKYGARFMIPARFLPPKFDYSRPIPASMLPPGALELPPSDTPYESTDRASQEVQALLPDGGATSPERNSRSGVTRNRIKGSRGVSRTDSSSMTCEPVREAPSHSLDCVICYNGIDVHNRKGYMLAPCNHVFHRECLVQWMDVKMECPICRTELPSL
jgi:hypothetical protein